MSTQAERGERFRALHEGETFLMPNPWDAGSAKVMAALGFEALATTSAGFAFTLGRLDGGVSLDELVAHVGDLTAAVDVPLSVDMENGYGPAPEDAARAVERVAGAGAVGGSIEDWEAEQGIYELDHAVERVRAAAEAAKSLSFPFTLTARAENHLRGNPDLGDTIARLVAYERAGADVVYAPGLGTVDEVRAVCAAVSTPVNVLAMGNLTMAEIAAAGGRRVSVGSLLTWVSVGALADAAQQARDTGDLSPLRPHPQLREWLAAFRA